ncbi:hypothetical protein VP01_2284g3 [Puccinia sorghi]|uniref:Tet-like 2OG-Fe(II) oxygenase domain-containing protein n=1 Tax=Puccinia sorghi TaxID=27349 RepID=A0A0L6V854_9BASI|nr:hypothetical protein VP01_2284g3 [Puccinia sorghi]
MTPKNRHLSIQSTPFHFNSVSVIQIYQKELQWKETRRRVKLRSMQIFKKMWSSSISPPKPAFFSRGPTTHLQTYPPDMNSIIEIIDDFLSTFLHGAKEFINPVSSSSRPWGSKMWAIGWRKSQEFLQSFGWQNNWSLIPQDGLRSLQKEKQMLMEKFNIPSFDSL